MKKKKQQIIYTDSNFITFMYKYLIKNLIIQS